MTKFDSEIVARLERELANTGRRVKMCMRCRNKTLLRTERQPCRLCRADEEIKIDITTIHKGINDGER